MSFGHRIMIPCVTFYILTKDFCLILYDILVHHGWETRPAFINMIQHRLQEERRDRWRERSIEYFVARRACTYC